jgi:hypothetical protein
LSEQKLSQEVKSITLSYLKKIGAHIEESDGLYTIEIPHKFEPIFGGHQKRITFESEIAHTHSCELVIFGSNFLATVIDQIKQQAPVVSGHLKKQGDFSIDLLNTIPVYRGTIKMTDSADIVKTIFRFYFNIDLKSMKNESTLQWVDVDSETLEKVEFPKELNLESLGNKMNFDKKSIDTCYDKAIKILQEDITPIINKHVLQTTNDMNQDLDSLELSYTKRVKELNQNVADSQSKLRDWDYKISHAKKYSTKNNYRKQKAKFQEKTLKEKNESLIQIERLKRDKKIQQEQITNRYTTKVNSNLVASLVFSYSINRCILEVKNQYSKNKTTGEYLKHSQKFVIPCNVCGVNSKEIHLCVNGHVGCDSCSEQCITCNKDFCPKCNYQLNSCVVCKEKNCNDCSSRCTYCHELICLKHEMNCAICEKKYCSNHTERCNICEQVYSTGCIDNSKCHTCDALTDIDSKDSKVLSVISLNSDLGKYKKWKYSTNSKFSIFQAKKMFGTKIIVLNHAEQKIIVDKKGGWL